MPQTSRPSLIVLRIPVRDVLEIERDAVVPVPSPADLGRDVKQNATAERFALRIRWVDGTVMKGSPKAQSEEDAGWCLDFPAGIEIGLRGGAARIDRRAKGGPQGPPEQIDARTEQGFYVDVDGLRLPPEPAPEIAGVVIEPANLQLVDQPLGVGGWRAPGRPENRAAENESRSICPQKNHGRDGAPVRGHWQFN